MAVTTSMPKMIDPKLTESYLMNLVGVVDASVWWQDGDLNAYVTVLDESPFSQSDYKRCCVQDLGLHQTPRNITIEQRRLRVA
ncbi:MAG: hypothetical protein J0L72_07930 [Armatimonadetes bacterium]|nr:hypothetical protein [Armatimonadota bacterium]